VIHLGAHSHSSSDSTQGEQDSAQAALTSNKRFAKGFAVYVDLETVTLTRLGSDNTME